VMILTSLALPLYHFLVCKSDTLVAGIRVRGFLSAPMQKFAM
jgi:hypothetical protein